MLASSNPTTVCVIFAVILSDYYDLPFNDIVDWHKFAVVLREKDVYELKQILKNITQDKFVTLHNNLVKVSWNTPSVVMPEMEKTFSGHLCRIIY